MWIPKSTVLCMNSGIFNSPFIIWGRYRKGIFKTTFGISFQFHHTQMDGAHAGRFLEMLQTEINNIKHLRIAADLQGTERDFL